MSQTCPTLGSAGAIEHWCGPLDHGEVSGDMGGGRGRHTGAGKGGEGARRGPRGYMLGPDIEALDSMATQGLHIGATAFI